MDVIASETKQFHSILKIRGFAEPVPNGISFDRIKHSKKDCFVSSFLAMTVKNPTLIAKQSTGTYKALKALLGSRLLALCDGYRLAIRLSETESNRDIKPI